MNKNPEQILDDNLEKVFDEFSNKNPNFILCSEPFMKSHFLNSLIELTNLPIIFLDFDLLFSGYTSSKMIQYNEKVELYRPNKDNFERVFSDVVKRISEKRYLVIIDSFNGLNNMFDELESGIFINSITMLLSSVSRQINSVIVVSAMAKKKEDEGWVLLPGGRRILEVDNSGIFYLKGDGNSLLLKTLNAKQEKVFEISQK